MFTLRGKKPGGLRTFSFCVSFLLVVGLFAPGAAFAGAPDDGAGPGTAAEGLLVSLEGVEGDGAGPGTAAEGLMVAFEGVEGAGPEGVEGAGPGSPVGGGEGSKGPGDSEGSGSEGPEGAEGTKGAESAESAEGADGAIGAELDGDVEDGARDSEGGDPYNDNDGDEPVAPLADDAEAFVFADGAEDPEDPPVPGEADAEAADLAGLKAALADNGVTTIEIPAGETVTLEGNDTAVIPDGKTLTVFGTLDILTTGDAVTGSKGFCAVEVESGGTLIVASGGTVQAGNSNAQGFTNNGVYVAGTAKFLGGSALAIDCFSRLSRGVTVSDGGVLELAGTVDIEIPWTGDIVNYGIFLSGAVGNQPTMRIKGGQVNISNTGGTGIHTTPYANPLEISGGEINVKNAS
ncbi:MAG: hypothetical protein FWG03_09500, partial [Clostridiales bacterium]|nr:hypothetical protein [Clostridiales bacterium]